ncbi:allantoicase-like [Venturia canescens]|uniref:allantoicase-like n=1 Tax=Venturia canescens TaxID=32260 RepID=UPI001C9CA233|nr:allantoicase-like [Venturia canescens]
MCSYNGNEIFEFVEHNELASATNGGRILFATDDFFAIAENLLENGEPVWKEHLFTDHGKWMDGWETRRKRRAGHDWTIIALGQRSIIEGFCIDTAYFTGNYAPRFSIQGAELSEADEKSFPPRRSEMGSSASEENLRKMAALKTECWETLVPMSDLKAGYEETRKSYFPLKSRKSWTHLRLNIYPDGGIARLRVYGVASPNWSEARSSGAPIDLISMKNGGICQSYSNAHYGHPRNLIKEGRPANMADGWETARRLDRPPVIRADDFGIIQVTGEEWAIFKLGHTGSVESIVVETTHFRGNFPDSVKVEGVLKTGRNKRESKENWSTVLPSRKLSPDKIHVYTSNDLVWSGPLTHVRIIMAPDGGFSRFKVLGNPTESHRLTTNLNIPKSIQ